MLLVSRLGFLEHTKVANHTLFWQATKHWLGMGPQFALSDAVLWRTIFTSFYWQIVTVCFTAHGAENTIPESLSCRD
jgi:hypothetical protein